MELKNKLVPKGQGKAPVQAGFTLIEIMIALAILAVGVLGLYTAQGNSLKASGTAEEVQIASTLAQQKMAEKMLEIEKDLQKGTLPEDKTEETGEFERPFQRYRWQYLVRQVDLPLAGGSGAEVAGDNAAPESRPTLRGPNRDKKD